jgi:hypothetical protein
VTVRLLDSLDDMEAVVYLFRQDSAAPSPTSGVTYEFELLSGAYLESFQTRRGLNPEDSWVRTPFYATHFADRWINDELLLTADGATAVDILDRHKILFGPGNCIRTDEEFSIGWGAFIANKSGPVRAIRSYVGARSGSLTTRTHLFYDQRQETTFDVRVHDISGLLDFFDYSAAASGMTYVNNLNRDGVLVDGQADFPLSGPLSWEMLTGEQGTLIFVHTITSDIPGLEVSSYYLDAAQPTTRQCTGDAAAYGASGPWLNMPLPCTDPQLCPESFATLQFKRVMYVAAPDQNAALAQTRDVTTRTPLLVTIDPGQPSGGAEQTVASATTAPAVTHTPRATAAVIQTPAATESADSNAATPTAQPLSRTGRWQNLRQLVRQVCLVAVLGVLGFAAILVVFVLRRR